MRILRPYPHIYGFYDGRVDRPRTHDFENWYDDGALELGICSYAIVDGDEAIVYDTHASLDHARFVRQALESLGVRHLTVVLSHWHADHVAGNAVFQDSEIIANALTRDALAAHRDELESELPPIRPLIMPTRTFERSLCLKVGRIDIELRHLDIHSFDGTVILLPADEILLAGDTLEDPITYVVEPERLEEHLRGLARLQEWSIDRILPNHGSPELIGGGGYDRRIIAATVDYIEKLLTQGTPEIAGVPLSALLSKHFESKAIFYHRAYESVHLRNLQKIRSPQDF